MVRPPGGLGPRLKSLALEEQIRHSIIDYLNKVGAATLAQITAQLRQEEGLIRWHLYVLEREGRIRSVRVGPYKFYFTKAKKAAEVILASLDPSLVPPEDRALLDLWASS
nr:MAG: hypothetical protein TU35_05300 [Thermoproteus sp. AZ2]